MLTGKFDKESGSDGVLSSAQVIIDDDGDPIHHEKTREDGIQSSPRRAGHDLPPQNEHKRWTS